MGIVCENISKSYGDNAVLRSVSLSVEQGDFATLLGPTGAGKTTLLRIMAGVEQADSGRVLYDGRDMNRVPVRGRPIAMVYQQFVNYPSLSLFENIASPLRAGPTKFTAGEIESRVHEVADLLGIRQVLTHRPGEVSGGQQQRCAIARAMVKEAEYIFLDEPLANLDFKLREELRSELRRLFRGRGGAVIYATPEPIDALSIASHVGVIKDGRLLQYGRTRDVYESPGEVAVGEYFSYPTMNVLEASFLAGDGGACFELSDSLRIGAGSLARELKPGPYLLGFRAHALDLSRRHASDVMVPGRVELSEVVGSDTEIHVTHAGHLLRALTERVLRFDLGEKIELFLDTRELFVFDRESAKLLTSGSCAAESTS